MSHLQYLPIDAGAKDGATHTLRDDKGHLWCGRWKDGGFMLAGKKECGLLDAVAVGAPILRTITDYLVRPQGQSK